MKTIDAFDAQFPTEESCRQFLANMRWPEKVRCPRCDNSERIYTLKARPFNWVCKNKDCGGPNGYRFTVISQTIFQDTKIPLKLWFKVGYLMLVSKKGVSALQVHRVIFGEDSGSDYRTSWYMCHRWRAAMQGEALKLSGEVEFDETYVGGKERNKHKVKRIHRGGSSGKIAVIGAIARKGMVVAQVIDTAEPNAIENFVHNTVSGDVSLIATDEGQGYRMLKRQGLPHETVSHTRGEYVRGRVHTANLDNFWSMLKRGIMGSFHHVSKEYLPLYVNEFSYRYNNRGNGNAFADMVTTCSK